MVLRDCSCVAGPAPAAAARTEAGMRGTRRQPEHAAPCRRRRDAAAARRPPWWAGDMARHAPIGADNIAQRGEATSSRGPQREWKRSERGEVLWRQARTRAARATRKEACRSAVSLSNRAAVRSVHPFVAPGRLGEGRASRGERRRRRNSITLIEILPTFRKCTFWQKRHSNLRTRSLVVRTPRCGRGDGGSTPPGCSFEKLRN